MADFKTHITTSTVVGIGYGAAGFAFGLPPDHCLLAAGICSVAGMLPDLDSDNGIPIRETFAFSAAIIPMLLIDRFEHMGLSKEAMVLAGGLIYLAVRFGLSAIFKRYTVHRGMWHSLPAAATVACIAYMLCTCTDESLRWFKSGAAFLGFMVHLVLDEIWAIEFKRGRPRFKKSFGTAIKFWGNSGWANFTTYAKLAIIGAMAFADPVVMQQFAPTNPHVHETAQQAIEGVRGRAADSGVLRRTADGTNEILR